MIITHMIHVWVVWVISQNCHNIQVLGISVMNWNILTTLMVLTIKHSSDHCQAKIYIGHPTLLPLAFCPPWNACVKIIVRYCQNSRRQNNPSWNISGKLYEGLRTSRTNSLLNLRFHKIFYILKDEQRHPRINLLNAMGIQYLILSLTSLING